VPRILVIEDDPEIGQIVREILERFGHELDVFQDAEQGLAAFELNRHDLVITDIILPEKDGVEAIRDLKVLDPEARVIAMTGMRGSFNRLPAAEFVGATRTLLKPFSQEDLVAVVDDVLQTTLT
jgi:DNA-binding response OmpR family regulator